MTRRILVAIALLAGSVIVLAQQTRELNLRGDRFRPLTWEQLAPEQKTMVNDLLAGLDEQVVLVTHHLHLLTGFDRVVVLDAGRVVADGKPAEAVRTYTGLLT